MSGRLPEGLITATGNIENSLSSLERPDAQTLRRMWNVFSVNSQYLNDPRARRMENFFWRIWSNRNVNTSISGNRMGQMARVMTESPLPGLESAAPTPSNPDPPTPVEATAPTADSSSSGDISPRQRPHEDLQQLKEGHEDGSERNSSETVRPLPPILKKNRTSSGESVNQDEELTPRQNSKSRSPHLKPSSSQVSSSSRAPERPSNPRKKSSTGMIAGQGGKVKSRPGMPRKRSSQGTVPTTKKKSPAASPYMRPARGSTDSRTGRRENEPQPPQLSLNDDELEGPGTASTFALGSSSWQEDDSPANSQDMGIASVPQPSSWLVDTDFRSRFEERQKRAASHSNLTHLGRTGSTVRFMEEVPERSQGKQRFSEVDTLGNVVRGQLQAVAARNAMEGEDEDTAVDDEVESPGLLPRTKSQLSFMIDQRRRHSGGLGPDPPPIADENIDPVKPASAADSDDGETLTFRMGVGASKIRTNSRSKAKGKGKEKAK